MKLQKMRLCLTDVELSYTFAQNFKLDIAPKILKKYSGFYSETSIEEILHQKVFTNI